MNFLISAN